MEQGRALLCQAGVDIFCSEIGDVGLKLRHSDKESAPDQEKVFPYAIRRTFAAQSERWRGRWSGSPGGRLLSNSRTRRAVPETQEAVPEFCEMS